jgi:hypothetical protein
VIVVIPLYHAIQPATDSGSGLMSPALQRLPDGHQGRPHSLLHREANELKPAVPVSPTTVGEPEEVAYDLCAPSARL